MLTSDDGKWLNLDTSGKLQYSFGENGLRVISLPGSSNGGLYLNINYPLNYAVEFKVTDYVMGDYGWSAFIAVEGVKIEWSNYYQTLINVINGNTISSRYSPPVRGMLIKFEVRNGELSVYRDNNLITTCSTVNDSRIVVQAYLNRGITIKDIIVTRL